MYMYIMLYYTCIYTVYTYTHMHIMQLHVHVYNLHVAPLLSLQYISLMKELGEKVPEHTELAAGTKTGVGVGTRIPPPMSLVSILWNYSRKELYSNHFLHVHVLYCTHTCTSCATSVAQLVEHSSREQSVVGSSPT